MEHPRRVRTQYSDKDECVFYACFSELHVGEAEACVRSCITIVTADASPCHPIPTYPLPVRVQVQQAEREGQDAVGPVGRVHGAPELRRQAPVPPRQEQGRRDENSMTAHTVKGDKIQFTLVLQSANIL